MPPTVLSRLELSIKTEDDVVTVRSKAREIAERLGFDAFATAAIVTATSELARNAWRHAGGGTAFLMAIDQSGRTGLRLDVDDTGPGIVDLERALAGGNSTLRSLGLGLAGSRRLADEFDISSTVSKGTHVSFTKWKRR